MEEAPTTHLIDLDFCQTWLRSRNIQKGMRNSRSCYNRFILALQKQRMKLPDNEWKALLGTICLRNSHSKKFSYDRLVNLASLAIEDRNLSFLLDFEADGYDEGTRISTEGHIRKDGRVFHAYKHGVQITDAYKYNIHMGAFTYTDTSPMLSFYIVYK